MKNILKGAMDPRMGNSEEGIEGNMTYKKLLREYEATNAMLKHVTYHNSVLKNLISKQRMKTE